MADLNDYEKILDKQDVTTEELNNILTELSQEGERISFDKEDLKRRVKEKLNSIVNAPSQTASSEQTSSPSENTAAEDQAAPTISIDENGESRLSEFSNNQERRNFVYQEFRNGKFTSQAHADFYINQLAEGNCPFPTGEEVEKLKTLLGGEKGITELQENIANNIVKNAVDMKVPPMVTGMAVTPEMLTPDDLGLSAAVASYKRNQNKDDIDYLLREAQKAAITNRLIGYEQDKNPYENFVGELKKQKNETPAWRLNRRRKLENAIRDVDPKSYYAAKSVTGNWLGRKTGYYKLRLGIINSKQGTFKAGENGQKEKDKPGKFDRLAQRLDKTLKLQKDAEASTLFSRTGGKKLRAKFQLFFRRSPEKLIKKMMNTANKTQLEAYTKKLEKDITTAKSQVLGDGKSIDANNAYQKKLQSIINQSKDRANALDEQQKNMIKALGNDNIESSMSKFDAFASSLDNKVAFLRERYDTEVRENPKLQLWIKANNGQLPENSRIDSKVVITHEAVLQQIAEKMGYKDIANMLKTLGVPEGEIESIKERLQPKNKEEKTEHDKPVNEQEAVNETQTNEGQQQASELSNVGNRQPEEDIKPDKTYDNGDTMLLHTADDKSRYDLITKDKDGQTREPTVEEIGALVERLDKDGIKEVVLEDSLSLDTREAMLKAMKEKGLTVTNEEEINRQLAEKEQSKEPEHNQPGSAEKDLPSQDKQSEGQTSEPQARPQETQPKNKEPMDIKQILNNAVKNSANQEELMAKLEMVTYVEAGKYNESFTELNKKINDTFGKGSAEAAFLGNMAAAKGLEQDMREEHSAAENKTWLNEEKKIVGINNKDADKAVKVSTCVDLADKYQGKTLEEMQKDPAYNLLPGYAQQGARNLFLLEKAEGLKPEEKTKLHGQILGQVIEGKNQSQRIIKEIKQRTIDRPINKENQGR